MKHLTLICFLLFLLIPDSGKACTMYKITKNGQTIVGNNEDYLSPNSQFWFETGTPETYGVMYMGLLDNFAQGAVNEAGLVFDGFWEPYLEIKNTEGKLAIPIGEALKKVMQTMSKVADVKNYLQTINLSALANGQLVFVDQSGNYLVLEGDEMILGDESEKTFSNFYYSQINSLEEVELDYFQKGQAFIDSTSTSPTFEYCSQAMHQFSQSKIAATQYTTIYDLNKLTIRVHLFNDFSEFIELDLKKELQKGDHRTMIAELFPIDSKGHLHYKKYNNLEQPCLFIEEMIGDSEISEQEYLNMGFDNIINSIASEWLYDLNKPDVAIKVCAYGLSLMPNNSSLYERLGEAYFLQEDRHNAIKHYAYSLFLNPENERAIEMIQQINDQQTQHQAKE
jgi:tetratricopeptide (TPR) repeat protein